MINPYIIGIAGPTCAGKTTICTKILEWIRDLKLEGSRIVIISSDRYYKGGNDETNYDIPEAIDFDNLIDDIKKLKKRETIYAPIYDFITHSRKKETEKIDPADIVIVEGILIFFDQRLRSLFDLKIFVTAQRELRYERRIYRDVKERGRNIDEIKKRYFKDVLPSNEHYVEPTIWYANIVLINNVDNEFTNLKICKAYFKKKLKKRLKIKNTNFEVNKDR